MSRHLESKTSCGITLIKHLRFDVKETDDLKELRTLANAATEGLLHIDSRGLCVMSRKDFEIIFMAPDRVNGGVTIHHEDTCDLIKWRNANDAAYIATFTPTRILRLLDRLEQLESKTVNKDRERVLARTLDEVLQHHSFEFPIRIRRILEHSAELIEHYEALESVVDDTLKDYKDEPKLNNLRSHVESWHKPILK